MPRREQSLRRFGRTAALAAALAGAWSCTRPAQARIGQTIEMGPFRVRVESVEVVDRRHQSVPVEVRVRLTCDGGNRFERMDFADLLSRKGKAYLRAADGWNERLHFMSSGDDARSMTLTGYPKEDRRGYVLSLGNPYGKPSRVEVDLGR